MTSALHPKYRADIDGLRAIAVLSVVFFHGFPDFLPGGFIGVDIFFVISGYLITTIILENIRNNSFSFGNFYARRIRRIFPALIIVLIFCHIIGWFLLMPSEYQQLGKHIAGGSTFISNILLWRESGYFDSSAESKPLLHLWSLGIEEQFYFVWPAILVIAYKIKSNLLKLICIVLCSSFIANILLSNTASTAAFFLPLSRFWELLLGAIIANYAVNQKGFILKSLQLRNFSSTLGVLLIIFSLILINKNSLFPGWCALLPTLGAALIISSGPEAWVNKKLLAHPLFIWFGLISFPLYLWHWPIFSFYRLYSFDEISISEYLVLIVISVFLAWGTYRAIESNFRHNKKLWKFSVLILGLISIGFIGWNCYDREGMPFRSIAQEKFNFHVQNAYGKTHCLNQLNQDNQVTCEELISTENRKRLVILWGDSHAAHLNAGLIARLQKDDITLLDVSLPACPPTLNFLPRQERPNAAAANAECQNNNLDAYKEIRLYKPQTVILAANWLQYDGVNQFNLLTDKKIGETIQAIKDAGVKNIILIGNFPVFHVEQPRLASMLFKPHINNRTLQRLNIESIKINEKLSEIARKNNVVFLSPSEILCNQEGCLLSTSQEKLLPMGLDVSHLSKFGSIFFIDQARTKNAITLQ